MLQNMIYNTHKNRIPIVIDDVITDANGVIVSILTCQYIRIELNYKCTKYCNKTSSSSGIIGRGHFMTRQPVLRQPK